MLTFIGLLLILGATLYFSFVCCMIWGLLKADNSPQSSEFPSVAVIVAARNEADNLPELLEDFLAQDYPGELSFIIADDRSTDSTWSLIHKFCKTHQQFTALRINEESTEMTGKKNALTHCIKSSTATIIIETDADCRVEPAWVREMVSQFDSETGIVVGFSSVRGRSLFAIYQALDFMGIMMSNAGMMALGKTWSGSGQNLAFKRAHFTSIGGFTGDPDQSIGDDFYLVQKIGGLRGVRARFSWAAGSFATTAASETIADFYLQRKRWASDTRGLHSKDPLFFSFLLFAFILNLAILLSVASLNFTMLLFGIVFIKFWLEFIIMIIGLKRLDRIKDSWVFLLWFPAQPIYIPIMGISGLFGKVPWK